MVGVTGIEPVTPSMSTLFPWLNIPELREKGTSDRVFLGAFAECVAISFMPSRFAEPVVTSHTV